MGLRSVVGTVSGAGQPGSDPGYPVCSRFDLWASASSFINGENHGSSLLRFGGRLNYNVSVSGSLACSACLIIPKIPKSATEVSSVTMEGKHFITILSKLFYS